MTAEERKKEYHGSTEIKRYEKMNLKLEKLKGINFLFRVSLPTEAASAQAGVIPCFRGKISEVIYYAYSN